MRKRNLALFITLLPAGYGLILGRVGFFDIFSQDYTLYALIEFLSIWGTLYFIERYLIACGISYIEAVETTLARIISNRNDTEDFERFKANMLEVGSQLSFIRDAFKKGAGFNSFMSWKSFFGINYRLMLYSNIDKK